MFSKASIFLLLAALSAPSSKMIVTLTCDHRQIYGADADLVLKEFIAVMGSPEQLLCRYIRSGLNRPQYIWFVFVLLVAKGVHIQQTTRGEGGGGALAVRQMNAETKKHTEREHVV